MTPGTLKASGQMLAFEPITLSRRTMKNYFFYLALLSLPCLAAPVGTWEGSIVQTTKGTMTDGQPNFNISARCSRTLEITQVSLSYSTTSCTANIRRSLEDSYTLEGSNVLKDGVLVGKITDSAVNILSNISGIKESLDLTFLTDGRVDWNSATRFEAMNGVFETEAVGILIP